MSVPDGFLSAPEPIAIESPSLVANSIAPFPIAILSVKKLFNDKPVCSPIAIRPLVVEAYKYRTPLNEIPSLGLSILMPPATVNLALAVVVPIAKESVSDVR